MTKNAHAETHIINIIAWDTLYAMLKTFFACYIFKGKSWTH